MANRYALVISLLLMMIVNDNILLATAKKTQPKEPTNKDRLDQNGPSPSSSPPSPPNIIFILADDLGWNDIGYHAKAGSLAKTPFLDRMAETGIKLENYYVQPVCSPTRSQLMTGRYQIRMGIQHTNFSPGENICLPLNETLLPELLQKQGYVTHAIGKWHLGMAKRACLPTRRGFDSFFGIVLGTSDHFTYERSIVYDKKQNRTATSGTTLYENENATTKYKGKFSAELYTERAIDIIREHKKRKPLFLYLPFQMVHKPDKLPKKYLRDFKRKVHNKNRRHYLGRVAALDHAVKNIVKALIVHQLYDNSVIIFSTDNGGSVKHMASNWPLRGGKGRLWEGGIRAVGFVHSPLLPRKVQGSSYHGLMHISDWFPTLIEGVAGGSLQKSVTKSLDGYNVWKSITSLRRSPRVVLLHNIHPFAHIRDWRTEDTKHWGPLNKLPFNATLRAAIRIGDWKLMTGGPGTGRRYLPSESSVKKLFMYDDQDPIRLYNIKKDPKEMNNLALNFTEKVFKMLTKLGHFQKQAVEPLKYHIDERSNPSLHNGAWTPWLDD